MNVVSVIDCEQSFSRKSVAKKAKQYLFCVVPHGLSKKGETVRSLLVT